MSTIRPQINVLQIVIGVLVLILGTLVYLVDRSAHETYFVTHSRLDVSFFQRLPNLFGVIGNHLPAFTHVFAFILITAGILACAKRGYLLIAIGWFVTDSLFEIGQKFGTTITQFIPDWFAEIPVLENTATFFTSGTFDWIDLMAIVLGTASAYVVLLKTQKRMTEPCTS